jgi:hypothetical protein
VTLAGSGSLYYAHEDTFKTLPGTPTWYEPGEEISIDNFTLQRNLDRKRKPDDPRPQGSRAGNREVALSLSWALTDTNWHDMALPAGGTGLATSGSLAPTATWYASVDTLPGTEEGFIQGGAVESWSLEYNQGESVTVSVTIIGATWIDAADADAPAVPSSPVRPSKDDIVNFQGADFNLNGSQLSTKLQSFSFEVSGAAQFRRGQQQEPVDAVVGAYEPSFSVTATLEDSTQRELAYGTSGATSPQDTVDSSSGEITLANPNGSLVTYSLANLQPTETSWESLLSAEENTSDPTTYHATDITTA